MTEFKDLIARTHKTGFKVLIDIVPNHVARNYEGKSTPEGHEPFGATDDKTDEYKRDNNFYYIPNETFKVPEWHNGYLPLGGEASSFGGWKIRRKTLQNGQAMGLVWHNPI